MNLEAEEPSGPRVVLRPDGDAFVVLIEPPLADGDHRACFYEKDSAWACARDLWCAHRLGFVDESDGHGGRANASRE